MLHPLTSRFEPMLPSRLRTLAAAIGVLSLAGAASAQECDCSHYPWPDKCNLVCHTSLSLPGFEAFADRPYKIESKVSGTLQMVGESDLEELMQLWANRFSESYPRVEFEIKAGSAAAALVTGAADFGPMSRQMTREELGSFRQAFGYHPTGLKVAVDAPFAAYTDKSNPITGGPPDDGPEPEPDRDTAEAPTRFVWLYVDKTPGKDLDSLTREFVRFIFSREGQRLVIRAGLSPVPSEIARQSLAEAGIDF